MLAFTLSQFVFAKAFGGWDDDRAYSIAQMPDGGYAVTGYVRGFTPGYDEPFILKLAPDGSVEWAKVYEGDFQDKAFSILRTFEGGYAIAGYTMSYGDSSADAFIIRLSPKAIFEWARTYGGEGWDEARSLVQTSDGGYAVAGCTESYGSGLTDLLVFRLAPNSIPIWSKAFGGTSFECANSIVQTSDGGFAVVGKTPTFGAGNYDILVLKLSSDGSLEWARTFGGSLNDYATSIVQAPDGGYVVAGYTKNFGAGSYDAIILKLSSDGSLEWAKTFGGSGDDRVNSILQTSDGGYALAGVTSSFGAGYYDVFLLKLSSDGSLEWAKTFGGSGGDYANSLIQTSDGGYAIAGYTENFGAGYYDILVLKLGPDGSYPGCDYLRDCSPEVEDVTSQIQVSSPDIPVSSAHVWIPSFFPETTEVSLREVEICATDISQSRPIPSLLALPAPGGLVFKSQMETKLRLYSASGRLLREIKLEKGENFVPLGPGVYLWQAEREKGKGVVK